MTREIKASEGTIVSLDGSRTITVEEFDQLFDDASDEIDQFIDWSRARRVGDAVDVPVGRPKEDDTAAGQHPVPRNAAE